MNVFTLLHSLTENGNQASLALIDKLLPCVSQFPLTVDWDNCDSTKVALVINVNEHLVELHLSATDLGLVIELPNHGYGKEHHLPASVSMQILPIHAELSTELSTEDLLALMIGDLCY